MIHNVRDKGGGRIAHVNNVEVVVPKNHGCEGCRGRGRGRRVLNLERWGGAREDGGGQFVRGSGGGGGGYLFDFNRGKSSALTLGEEALGSVRVRARANNHQNSIVF